MAAARTFVQLARACRRTLESGWEVGPAPAPNRNTPPLPHGNGASTLSADNRNDSHCAGFVNHPRCNVKLEARAAWLAYGSFAYRHGLFRSPRLGASALQSLFRSRQKPSRSRPQAPASLLRSRMLEAEGRLDRAPCRAPAARRQRRRRAASDRPGALDCRRSGRPRGGIRRDRAERSVEAARRCRSRRSSAAPRAIRSSASASGLDAARRLTTRDRPRRARRSAQRRIRSRPYHEPAPPADGAAPPGPTAARLRRWRDAGPTARIRAQFLVANLQRRRAGRRRDRFHQ